MTDRSWGGGGIWCCWGESTGRWGRTASIRASNVLLPSVSSQRGLLASWFALALAAGNGLVPGGLVRPPARPRRDPSPGLRYHRSLALHNPGPPTAHTWCLVAATRQSLGPRPVHSRSASRVGVSKLGIAHTWCLIVATRQSLGPRAVHSRTVSRVGVSRLGIAQSVSKKNGSWSHM